MYVSLESHFGNTRIATMKTKLVGLGLTKFGGVIFCRSDRNDIQSVKDLPGKRFMAVDKKFLAAGKCPGIICLITKLILTRILKSLCSAAPTMWWCLPCLIDRRRRNCANKHPGTDGPGRKNQLISSGFLMKKSQTFLISNISIPLLSTLNGPLPRSIIPMKSWPGRWLSPCFRCSLPTRRQRQQR